MAISHIQAGLLVLGLAHLTVRAEMEFSSTLQQELAVNIASGAGEGVQKFESVFEPEWFTPLGDNLDMTLIARARFDAWDELGYEGERLDTSGPANGPLYEGNHADVEVREWFFDTEIAGSYWRLGKQQVVWGQADGLKVLDVVNPQSYREFILDDFADSRIPLWLVNAEIPLGEDDSLQLLWIPDLTYHDFANQGSVYAMTSPLLVPQPVEGLVFEGISEHKPNSTFADSDVGLRYASFTQGWDLTLNYLYHYQDSPVFYHQVSLDAVSIRAEYERNHLLGATASKAFGDFTLRTEVGYSSDSYHLLEQSSARFVEDQGIHRSADLSSVIGLDWQGLQDTMVSVQWFQSYLFDYERDLVRPQQNHIFSMLYRQTFLNETWELEFLGLYSEDQGDTSMQAKLSHMWESNIQVWVAVDTFAGDRESLFGQFDQADRMLVGVEWGF